MTNYVCKNCGYRISSDKKKVCPYCGESDLEREKSAEELLNEADD